MSPLIFLLSHQLKNIIRRISRKPLVLIGYIFLGLMLLGFLALALFLPSGIVRKGSVELFHAIMTGLISIAFYFSLRQGIEKGSSYFRLSDVNLVFTAPFKTNRVLLYGFIKNMGTALLIVMFALFQIPNVKNNFQLQSSGVLYLLLAVLLYSILSPLLGMVVYMYTSGKKAARNYAKRLLDLLMAVFVAGLFLKIIEFKSLEESLTQYFGMGVFTYFPVIGQLGTIATAAAKGVTPAFYFSISAIAVLLALCAVILFKKNPDYYEDVLEATEYKEKLFKAKKEGRGNMYYDRRKVKSVKSNFTASGAGAIFQKHLLEYRKNSFFLFFDKSSIFVILFGIAFKFLMPPDASGMFSGIFTVLFFSVYMLFFFIIQGKWPQELEKPYIFLIPAPNGKKLIYATLTENIKNLLDGTLLFIIAGFMFKVNPLIPSICVICYVLYGAVYIYGDIVSRRLFGKVHSKAMQVFVKLFVSLVVVIPGIILYVIAMVITGNEIIMALAIAVWNLIAASGLFLAAKGIFANIEIP